MTPRRGSRGMGRTYPPGSATYPPAVTGDRTDSVSYPPGRSTHETPAQGHKSIDVTGDPGDRTPISTPRDVRDEISYASATPYDGMCPHSCREKFSAHEAEGPKQPPYHPDPPDLRCIWCPDQREPSAGERNLSPATPGPTPGPEPVGAIAERVLTDLAHGRDPHLAARQQEALQRLTRAHTTSPLLTRKEQKP